MILPNLQDNPNELKSLLDYHTEVSNNIRFIEKDPISIPHLFTSKQDIEISGLFAAILAWGQRSTIIAKCNELMQRMDNSPYNFIKHHSEADLKNLLGFKHRTFNDTDLLYFINFLKTHYSKYNSLENAFLLESNCFTMENALNKFSNYFTTSSYFPTRTRKHIASPERKSACKRLNMYLRWMVRKDHKGVDFGVWSRIPGKALICPIDVHVERTARALGLIRRTAIDWQTAIELTNNLRIFDPNDPVKYDFALFSISNHGLL
ncbi:TIGR02757 family protein [Porphyromonas pogonae]|uniref:TIGR02757 family protein n=1 Tax=Porphyromonas pogonae TaxID=867595 RepID=UPI002E7A569C|nr:TIGR02757 family protein [Porphyromonas pogonae]